MLADSESLKWPGFVEFDDINKRVLTYSATDKYANVAAHRAACEGNSSSSGCPPPLCELRCSAHWCRVVVTECLCAAWLARLRRKSAHGSSLCSRCANCRVYKVWNLLDYQYMFTVNDENVEETKIRCVLLLFIVVALLDRSFLPQLLFRPESVCDWLLPLARSGLRCPSEPFFRSLGRFRSIVSLTDSDCRLMLAVRASCC